MLLEDIKINLFRFENNIALNSTTGCLEWKLYLDKDGYGSFRVGTKKFKSHRLAYLIKHGEIDDSLVIDHKCRNRSCCNPEHLRLVPKGVNTIENSLAASAKNTVKTHCKNGHPLTGDNLKVYLNKGKYARQCVTCHKILLHKWYLKNRKTK